MGTTDLGRLENAVLTTEQLMPMLLDTVRSIGGDISSLSARVGGTVDNVARASEVNELNDNTERTVQGAQGLMGHTR